MGRCRVAGCEGEVDLTPPAEGDTQRRYCDGPDAHRFLWVSLQQSWIGAGVRGDEFESATDGHPTDSLRRDA